MALENSLLKTPGSNKNINTTLQNAMKGLCFEKSEGHLGYRLELHPSDQQLSLRIACHSPLLTTN